MGLVALGAGKGVFGVHTPPLYRFVHAVNGSETCCAVVPYGGVGQSRSVMTIQAQPGESLIALLNAGRTAEGVTVKNMLAGRLRRRWSIGIRVLFDIPSPGPRPATSVSGYMIP